jgi:ligand-binding sensor protein
MKRPSFEALFDLDEIQPIQDAFAEATQVASVITTPDGVPLTRPSNFRRLCADIIRGTRQGLANCMGADAAMGALNRRVPATVRRCRSAGLWQGGASIHCQDRHIANWLIGQVRDKADDPEAMVAYAHAIGADPEEYRQALAEVPVMDPERFALIAQSLYLNARMLSRLAFQAYEQAEQIRQLNARIGELESMETECVSR